MDGGGYFSVLTDVGLFRRDSLDMNISSKNTVNTASVTSRIT